MSAPRLERLLRAGCLGWIAFTAACGGADESDEASASRQEHLDGYATPQLIGDMVVDLDRLGVAGGPLSAPLGATGYGYYSTLAWPAGVVPYEFGPEVLPAHRVQFLQACGRWGELANVRCLPRNGEPTYARVTSEFSGCFSSAGRQGTGHSSLNLAAECWTDYVVEHELGHLFGLMHEQQRSDRDAYVTINSWNVQPGAEGQFVTLFDGAADVRTGYDFTSVMHYASSAFAVDYAYPTISAKPPHSGIEPQMGSGVVRDGLQYPSDDDGAALRAVYGGPLFSGRTSAVHVSVLDGVSGQNVSTATVTLQLAAPPHSVLHIRTDTDGRAINSVVNGSYNAWVSAPGYATAFYPAVPVTASNYAPHVLWLGRGPNASNAAVRLQNKYTGAPVANAVLRVNDFAVAATAGGLASIFLPHGPYTVSIEAPGYVPVTFPYHHAHELVDYGVPLEPMASSFRIRVVDGPTNAPLDRAGVTLNDFTFFTDEAGLVDIYLDHGPTFGRVTRFGYRTHTQSFHHAGPLDFVLPLQRE